LNEIPVPVPVPVPASVPASVPGQNCDRNRAATSIVASSHKGPEFSYSLMRIYQSLLQLLLTIREFPVGSHGDFNELAPQNIENMSGEIFQ
jgi:hypothetical protein